GEAVISNDRAVKPYFLRQFEQLVEPPAFEDPEFNQRSRHLGVSDLAKKGSDVIQLDPEQGVVRPVGPDRVVRELRGVEHARLRHYLAERRPTPCSVGFRRLQGLSKGVEARDRHALYARAEYS